MSQVLYRKYRPKFFKEVIGQKHVVKTLTNALSQNILSHGYLFTGPHGTGKTTIARLLAKALNCEKRQAGQFEPCDQCNSCLEINQNSAIDLIEIDAASNRGIDEIRDLKEGIRFKPAKSKYKVFIIDESHQLTKEASNALLKTLEEPPSHAVFVLATTEAHKMIPTIQSRCQRFDFHKLTLLEITARLKRIMAFEKIKFEDAALNLIALQASGAARDAETLLDQAVSFSPPNSILQEETVRLLLGMADKTTVFKFLALLEKNQGKQAIELINEIIFKGVDLKEFIKSVIAYLREALLLKITGESKSALFLTLTQEEKQQLISLSQNFSEKLLQQALELLMQAENKMKYASILQLPLELAIIDICQKTQ